MTARFTQYLSRSSRNVCHHRGHGDDAHGFGPPRLSWSFEEVPVDMTPSRRLLAIADDLSGAAEVAAAVCSRTTRSRVLLLGGPGAVGMATALRPRHAGEATVLDLDSRYRPAAEAAEAVRGALRMSWPDGGGQDAAAALGALDMPAALDTPAALAAPAALDTRDTRDTFVLKKIDSLLRGNVAAEIAALAEGGAGVVLAPALPIAGRVVRSGVVHIGGVPLHEGDAWRAEAVPPPASVAQALGGLPTALIPLTTVRASRPTLLTALRAAATAGRVAICDAETDADLDAIVEASLADGPGMRLVGSGGLALAVGRHLATTFPATEALAAPDATDRAAPGAMGPAAPDATDPAAPRTTGSPAAPGTTDPATPGATGPAAPDATDPAAPATTDPAAPDATDPAAPATTDPTAPDATGLAAPGATDPTAPRTTGSPAAPGTTDPATPGATGPAAPGTTDPAAPATTDPTANDTGSPVAAGPAVPGDTGPGPTAVVGPAVSDVLGGAGTARAGDLAASAVAAPSAYTARPVLVVVGTAEPAAVEQVRRLVEDGASHHRLPLAGLLADGPPVGLPALTAAVTVVSLGASPKSPGPAPAYEAVALPSPREAEPMSGRRLVLGLARAVGAAVAAHHGAVDLVLTGGETARRVLDALAVTELDPVGQVHHGAVHLRTPDGRSVVTRPGSFGDPDSLRHIVQALRPHSTERKVTS
ncbi:four-carbon acid sugar kinase family protein [Streptomyces sp. Inha503]|uniref:four-carbon acid sugar kinase family protein n=1 Tax=Streptomyces sp. Inha503 TaxID=3383314 RepID=UPI0039A0D0E8